MYEANRPALEDRIQVMKEMWLKNIERQFSNHDHSGDLRRHQANGIKSYLKLALQYDFIPSHHPGYKGLVKRDSVVDRAHQRMRSAWM